MIKGVYIGKKDSGDYDLVSTGDYINPISPVFRLKDTGKTLQQIVNLYMIVNDISIEYAKIKIVGQMTTIRLFLSWDKKIWNKEIEIENIDANGTTIIKPFYLRFGVDDVLQYFNLRNLSSIKNFKLKLLYN